MRLWLVFIRERQPGNKRNWTWGLLSKRQFSANDLFGDEDNIGPIGEILRTFSAPFILRPWRRYTVLRINVPKLEKCLGPVRFLNVRNVDKSTFPPLIFIETPYQRREHWSIATLKNEWPIDILIGNGAIYLQRYIHFSIAKTLTLEALNQQL
jgi:hypothetical protein